MRIKCRPETKENCAGSESIIGAKIRERRLQEWNDPAGIYQKRNNQKDNDQHSESVKDAEPFFIIDAPKH